MAALKTKNILITGGAGFVGFHLVRRLSENPRSKILVVDNLQRGKYDDDFQSLLKNKRVSFVQGDLTDPTFFKTLKKDFHHVYHLAAVNGTKNFYEIPHEVLRINVVSLVNILEWIKTLKKKPKLMFTSSNEAYASALEAFGQLPIPTPENVPLVISDTYNPRWSYGASKLIGEKFVIYYAQAYKFPAVVVRPHNFYGPRAGRDHVIPQFIQRIHERKDPFLIMSPDETRSFCFIEDAVEAMERLMDAKSTDTKIPHTVHIGNNTETSIQELADTLFVVAGYRPKKFTVKPSPKGSVKRRLPDVRKIKKLVGWKHQTSLEEGLRKTFDWYSNKI